MTTPTIDTISIEGFKSFASLEKLPLRPINLVIGANGSGKSNFIGAFAFLHTLKAERLEDYILKAGGANKVLHFGVKTTPSMKLHISFQDEVNQYEITLYPTDEDELVPGSERVYYWDKKKYPRPYEEPLHRRGKEAGISQPAQSRTVLHVQALFDRWRLYHFHDTSPQSPMNRTADVHDNHFLRPDASNLAAFLYLLQSKHEPSYQMIRRTIQRMVPFFDDFLLQPQQLNPDKIRLEWKHKHSDAYFGTSTLSDGTLRFIALTTLLMQPDEFAPSVILLDEPELGLHPYAITLLASMIKMASTRAQLIISTQSSLLLDHFQPDDVLVANRAEGGTQLARLEEGSLTEWLEEYSLGQLWEKNELGGRPQMEVPHG